MTTIPSVLQAAREEALLGALLGGGVLLTALLCPGSPYDDFERFAFGGLILPAVVALWGTARLWRRVVRVGAVSGGWLLGYRAFVSYQDHPWFAGPETFTCDGPCFGWYTFEFRPPIEALIVVVGLSAAMGLAARWVWWISQREQSILET